MTLGAVGQHDLVAQAEAGVQLIASLARVSGAVPPFLARGAEANVPRSGHVVEEKSVGDVVDEYRRQVGPISPARTCRTSSEKHEKLG